MVLAQGASNVPLMPLPQGGLWLALAGNFYFSVFPGLWGDAMGFIYP